MRGGHPTTANQILELCKTKEGTDKLKQSVANEDDIEQLTINVKTARRMINKWMDDMQGNHDLTNRSANLQSIEHLLGLK
jgi:hypothetical protein